MLNVVSIIEAATVCSRNSCIFNMFWDVNHHHFLPAQVLVAFSLSRFPPTIAFQSFSSAQ
jgi:hypothetical protein